MRLSFDAEVDEEAAHTAREALVGRFTAWLDRRPDHRTAEPADVDLALGWKLAYADGNYGRWTRDDIDELLLDHFPRKLSATPDEAASIPPSLAAFVTFLDDEGLLARGSDPAEVLAARALAQQRSFLDAMVEPANFGMAKRFFSSAGLDPDGELDQAQLDDVMAQFNALPFDQRGRILGLDGPDAYDDEYDEDFDEDEDDDEELPSLPLRAAATADELAAGAAEIPLLRRVEALRAGLGEKGAKLTKAGQLTLADARRLVEATGVGDRTEGIRSSAELPELFGVGQVAHQAGAIVSEDGRLRAEPDWDDLPPAERWQAVVDGVLLAGASTLSFGAVTPAPVQLADLADQMAFQVLAALWVAEEPIPTRMFAQMMEIAALELGPPPPVRSSYADLQRKMAARRAAEVIHWLAEAGVITVTGGDGTGEDGDVTLTPTGVALAARPLSELGFGILLADDVAGLDGAELVELVLERGDNPALVAPLWAPAHPGRAGADEIVAALDADPDPGRVLTGFALLRELGPATIPTLRDALDGPLAGHAWLVLAEFGEVAPEDVPMDAVTQAGVDLFVATAELGTPADVIEMVLGHVPTGDHVDFVDRMAASGHPRTGELMDLLGRHHPDKAVAKHARKVAHRWRSAHGG